MVWNWIQQCHTRERINCTWLWLLWHVQLWLLALFHATIGNYTEKVIGFSVVISGKITRKPPWENWIMFLVCTLYIWQKSHHLTKVGHLTKVIPSDKSRTIWQKSYYLSDGMKLLIPIPTNVTATYKWKQFSTVQLIMVW